MIRLTIRVESPPPPLLVRVLFFSSKQVDLFYFFTEGKIGPKFSHLLMVRLGGGDPPLPYGQPDHKIPVFYSFPNVWSKDISKMTPYGLKSPKSVSKYWRGLFCSKLLLKRLFLLEKIVYGDVLCLSEEFWRRRNSKQSHALMEKKQNTKYFFLYNRSFIRELKGEVWRWKYFTRSMFDLQILAAPTSVSVMVMVMMVMAENVSKHDAIKGILIWSQPLCLAHHLIIDSIYSIHPFRVLRLCPFPFITFQVREDLLEYL